MGNQFEKDPASRPTIILDGIEVSCEKMQSFLPKQIESSKVLKGQSAAVKHGASKGVNGVNEIFLKKDISTKMNSEQQESKVFVKLEEEAEFPGGAIAWGN